MFKLLSAHFPKLKFAWPAVFQNIQKFYSYFCKKKTLNEAVWFYIFLILWIISLNEPNLFVDKMLVVHFLWMVFMTTIFSTEFSQVCIYLGERVCNCDLRRIPSSVQISGTYASTKGIFYSVFAWSQSLFNQFFFWKVSKLTGILNW